MPTYQRYKLGLLLTAGLPLFRSKLLLFLVLTIFYPGGLNAYPGQPIASLAVPFTEANAASGCEGPQREAKIGNLTANKLKRQQTEREVGRRLAAKAEQNAVMLVDESIVRYVNRIEQRIVESSELSGCFIVKILVDPEPNAYSLPGGFVYLTTGIIEVADSEGQLAAALAHETAHITGRHLIRFESETRIYGRLALFSSPAGYLLHRYLGPLLMFGLVRRLELEADQIGVRYHINAGYDPLEFCRLLQSLSPEGDGTETFFDRISDTHPETKVRVKRLKFMARMSESAAASHLVSTSEFQEMKARFAILRSLQ